MSKNYGWLCVDEWLLSMDSFWISLGGNFFPSGKHKKFCIGGNVYLLGVSDFFLEFDGEADLAPTYEPILDAFYEWESFNMIRNDYNS